jgi:hypothetical protein
VVGEKQAFVGVAMID